MSRRDGSVHRGLQIASVAVLVMVRIGGIERSV